MIELVHVLYCEVLKHCKISINSFLLLALEPVLSHPPTRTHAHAHAHVWNVIRAKIIATSSVETPQHHKTTALCASLLVRAARNF